MLSLDSNVAGPALRHQTSSSWEVMVARLQLVVGWVNGIKFYHEFVLPPLPLSSNSASSLWNALFNHPLTKPLTSLVNQILLASKLSAWIHETDGHLANEKLHFHLYQQRLEAGVSSAQSHAADAELPSSLTEQVLCQNHQVQLSIVGAVESLHKHEATGGKTIPNLFCATLFLRMGGHFVRLLSSVQVLISQASFFHWIPFPTSEQLQEGRRFSQELISYLTDNLRRSSREMSSRSGGPVVQFFHICRRRIVMQTVVAFPQNLWALVKIHV